MLLLSCGRLVRRRPVGGGGGGEAGVGWRPGGRDWPRRSGRQRGVGDAWQVVITGRVYAHVHRLQCRTWQRLEIPVPLLQERRRSDAMCIPGVWLAIRVKRL